MAAFMPAMNSFPGITAITETEEKELWWGRQEHLLMLDQNIIGSAAVDAANTPTTTLRAGLLLGRKTSDNLLYAWDPDATTGIEIIVGILGAQISMLDASGTAENKMGPPVYAGGSFKAAQLLIEGTVFTSSTSEHLARRQMFGRFRLDDDYNLALSDHNAAWTRELAVTAATRTVTHAENGMLFTTLGGSGSNFTLPALEAGLTYSFINLVDQNMVITSAAGNDIFFKNDLAASTLTFSTMSEKIGAFVTLRSNAAGTAWYVENKCTNTVTVA